MKDIWYKKYRPLSTDGYVFQNDQMKEKITEWIDDKQFPNLLLIGEPGTGKTTLAHILANNTGIDPLDIREVSASIDRGIEEISEKVINFAQKSAFGSNGRLVILDECLEENQKVRIGTVDKWEAVALKDLVWGETYPVVSFNMGTGGYENDTGTLISEKNDEVFEVELENGNTVVLNAKHPFIVRDSNGNYIEKSIEDGLSEHDFVVHATAGVSKPIRVTSRGTAKVRNLTVHKNHTFVTENGIVTHNCDYLSSHSQASLRNLIGSVGHVRFILIANYEHKIIPALKSRCAPLKFERLQEEPFVARMVDILKKENIKFEIDTVFQHFKANYPDLRKAINSMEFSVLKGELQPPMMSNSSSVSDWMKEAVVYFEMGQIAKAREVIIENITYEDYDYFYEFLYKEVDLFAKGNEDKKDASIITIAQAMVDDTMVGNREITLSACLSKLNRISKK